MNESRKLDEVLEMNKENSREEKAIMDMNMWSAISSMVNGPHGIAVVIGVGAIASVGMGTLGVLAFTGHFPNLNLMINNFSVYIPDMSAQYNPAV